MKKFLVVLIISILSLLVLIITTLAFILYVKPELVFNSANLDKVLERTQVLKEWKWEKAQIEIAPINWNQFEIKINFSKFCFTYIHNSADINSCLERLNIFGELKYDLSKGAEFLTSAPIIVISNYTDIKLKESVTPKEASPPPDVWAIWQILWSKLIPDLEIDFSNITLHTKESDFNFGFTLLKDQKSFKLTSFDFELLGTSNGLQLKGPKTFKLPVKDLHLNDFLLDIPISEDEIKLHAKGFIESAPFEVKTKVDLPINDDPTSVAFLRKIALETYGNMRIENIKKTLKTFGKPPYNELPAPINAMDGGIFLDFKTHKTTHNEEILVIGDLKLNLESSGQALKLGLDVTVPLSLVTYAPGPIGIEIILEKVLIQLPKISKTSMPPQFMPDSRFKSKKDIPEEKKIEKKGPAIEVHLDAQGEKALNLRTDLLDEILRINFNLHADQNGLNKGYVKILPLKTTVFKRPIEVKNILITFQELIDPIINASIEFPLPEYRIFLDLEGPVAKPKYAFRSEPPLPQNDIYAVLLFGRPMADLDPDTQGAAGQTNKILSQGVLSLSVLYFLAGSPVEYVAYDPKSKEAQAQIGLGRKTSLRVGAGQDGKTSTGIRRSLGSGWYLDTSVQNSNASSSTDKDYGVLLERIIAY